MDKIPQDVKDKMQSYVYKWPGIAQKAAIEDLEYGYSLASEQLLEKDKEIGALKEKVNELTMADMTHEYNEAEGERFRPEYERQLLEPLQGEIKRLKGGLQQYFDLMKKAETEQHFDHLLQETNWNNRMKKLLSTTQ